MKGMNPDFGRPYTPPETEHHRKLSEEMAQRRVHLKGTDMTTKTKVRQGHLNGLEPPRIKAIDDAAETYYEAIRERLPLTQAEKDAKENLIEKMKEHQVDRYETPDGLVVVVTSKSKVKVKKKAETNGEEDDDEDE